MALSPAAAKGVSQPFTVTTTPLLIARPNDNRREITFVNNDTANDCWLGFGLNGASPVNHFRVKANGGVFSSGPVNSAYDVSGADVTIAAVAGTAAVVYMES